MVSTMDRFPSIRDLERRARWRIPSFAWTYLESGTGDDIARDHNSAALQDIRFQPQFLKGKLDPQISTSLFGVEYSAPIGIAPVGLTGLIWPGADAALATTAASERIPYVLSTVATTSPEAAGPRAKEMGWFQLYPPRDESLRRDLIARARESGFSTLVVTADVPSPSRRERQRKARLRVPPKIGPVLIAQSVVRPAWSIGTLRHGLPRFVGLEKYVDSGSLQATAGFVGANLGGTLSWDYLDSVRQEWDGPLVVKGILDPDDARRCVDCGADAVWVSNHGGRQLDGAIASIEALPAIATTLNKAVPVLFDSGIRDGIDVARAIALGADFCFAGRPFLFGLGAIGDDGARHALEILVDGLRTTMHQVGVEKLDDLHTRLR